MKWQPTYRVGYETVLCCHMQPLAYSKLQCSYTPSAYPPLSFRERNETAANATMNAIKSVLKKSGFITHKATIISGLKEASSAWTSVNYLSKTVRQNGVIEWQCAHQCTSLLLCCVFPFSACSALIIQPNSWHN